MSNIIIIDDLLNDENRVYVPNHLKQLIKDNLEVVPVTTYKLRSNCSEYEYTKDELDWTKDHINQLIEDIIIANLDKVKHLDNRIYKFFKEGKTYWRVRENTICEIIIRDFCNNLELACDQEYDYILTNYFIYIYKIDENKTSIFNNNKDFLKFGGQYLDKFFETEDEALNYIKEEQNNGQID